MHDARGHLDNQSVSAPGAGRACGGAGNQRAHGKRPRPPRIHRRRRGAGVSRRRDGAARPVPARRHGSRLRADPRRGRRRPAHLRARRLRRRRDRGDHPRRAAPARARRGRRLAPAEPLRRGLRRRAARRLRASPTRAAGSSSRSTAASRRSRRSPRRRRAGSRSSSPTITGPVRSLPDCPIVATRPSDYPFPELCGTGVVYKLGQALFGVDSEIPKRHLDLVALATIADVVPLLDENRSLAIAGLRALARTQKLGLQALMRVAGVDPAADRCGRRRLPARPAHQRRGPARPSARGARAPAHRRRRRGTPARQLARGAEQGAAGGRGPHSAEAIAQVESWPEEHRQRRAYVVAGEGLARRGDRDRRLAARREDSTAPSS